MRTRIATVFAGLLTAVSVPLLLLAQDPFAAHVRPTDPLSPQEQAKSFQLPAGFQVELFASEPQIQKPMNIAFDDRGRLWLTDTREYPYPVGLEETGRDTIKVLEDVDRDGQADRITTFMDGLNIPIGIYPYKNGAITWSIPNIWYFEDTDGDLRADRRERIVGPLGWERDTHGMNSSFKRGFDGWLYATHGFNNESTVRMPDGTEFTMQSGNVYRFQPDGRTAQWFTHGQVNPFGLCFDPMGNLYSADCHSAPIYQLLRNGYYPSFGKPHDGLGFAPVLMQHSHGSTAISGIVHYSDTLWPEAYRDNILVGNVMTSRVNRDRFSFQGSSPTALEKPDFIRAKDPWFRPVNLQLGPDGALYVADFYNRIIGHYEVPLDHPGRDRHRGRIWRVTYHDPETGKPRLHEEFNLTNATIQELLIELGHSNLTRRLLALNHIVDSRGEEMIPPLQRLVQSSDANALQRVHAFWALHRMNALPPEMLLGGFQHDATEVRVHIQRILSETFPWSNIHRRLAMEGLHDSNALVRRTAADALGQHPQAQFAKPLLHVLLETDSSDDHLVHTLRMALRNQLETQQGFDAIAESGLNQAESAAVAEICLAIENPLAAAFLIRHIQRFNSPPQRIQQWLRHASQHAPTDTIPSLVKLAQEKFPDRASLQVDLFQGLRDGLNRRGHAMPREMQDWGAKVVRQLLNLTLAAESAWQNHSVPGMPASENPWFLQERRCADGQTGLFLSSLPPAGEHLTGVLRSPEFTIPAELQFFLAGHDGFPDMPAQHRNEVRLVAVQSGGILARQYAPRTDTAQPVRWQLEEHIGKKGRLELVDADNGSAYAWLAAGRFAPAIVSLPELDPRKIADYRRQAARLASQMKDPDLHGLLAKTVQQPSVEPLTQQALVEAILALEPSFAISAASVLLGDPATPPSIRKFLVDAAVENRSNNPGPVLDLVWNEAPYRLQLAVARRLAGSSSGAESLIEAIRERNAPASLLQDGEVQEKVLASNVFNSAEVIRQLTADLPEGRSEMQQVVEARRKNFSPENASMEKGEVLFNQACAVCHQINGRGGLIGPQLDGIGNRGLERLLEDILIPNRNVDHAFYTETVVLKNGDVLTGMARREEGQLLIFANTAGQEIEIEKSKIATRKTSSRSLMPDNFEELFSEDQLNDLMLFLLKQRTVFK